MNLLSDLLLKGNGVLVQGQHAEDRGGLLRAFSPGEMKDAFDINGDGALTENPFHIDPETGESMKGKPGYDCRNIYEVLVEGIYHHLVKKLGELPPEDTKRTLRSMVNKAVNQFNQEKMRADPKTKDLYPHIKRWGRHVPDSAMVFTDVNTGALHPELHRNLNVYAPNYQKLGNFGNHVSPEGVRIKNKQGQFVTLNHSGKDHGVHGHMSEGGFFGAIMQYLGLVAGHWKVQPPHTMSTGNIKPEEYVIHTDENGLRSNFWKYWHANEDPSEAENPIPDAHKKHRSISLRSGLGSLWEGFFQPALHPRDLTPERRKYAAEILTKGGNVPRGMVSDDDISNFSRSILMQILEDSRAGNTALRSATKTFHWYNEMRKAVGLPKWSKSPVGPEEAFLPQDMTYPQRELVQKFNYNVHHMGLDKTMGPGGRKHTASNKVLKQGLLLSYWLEDPMYRKNATEALSRMPNADGNGLQEGQRLKQLFMQVHNDQPFYGDQHYDWLDPAHAAPVENRAVRIGTGEWATPEGGRSIFPQMRLPMPRLPRALSRPRPQRPLTGDEGHVPREMTPDDYTWSTEGDDEPLNVLRGSNDSLYDLMESLQSADARMDELVMKSIPVPRRHDLNDETDLRVLCEHYDLSESDLHYIDHSVGDWSDIAQRLKVDPHIVKAVKVALRW